ncbi:MAG: DUF4062 domain-containing protein [Chloroflexota bacterium]|nr:DUF4062 domain-containing protein [Chloroflexota bacterium]
MTTNQTLSLFISSKMQELAAERRALQKALATYLMKGWLWEDDAGARPEPVRSTYLTEVEACDIYIGLFWHGYGPYTIEEYNHARHLHKPCLVYEKYVDVAKRDPQLASFLKQIEAATNPEGLTVRRFTTPEELASFVQEDVQRLLTTTFRNSRKQPSKEVKPSPHISMRADRGGITVYNNPGTISQQNYNYGNSDAEDDE